MHISRIWGSEYVKISEQFSFRRLGLLRDLIAEEDTNHIYSKGKQALFETLVLAPRTSPPYFLVWGSGIKRTPGFWFLLRLQIPHGASSQLTPP